MLNTSYPLFSDTSWGNISELVHKLMDLSANSINSNEFENNKTYESEYHEIRRSWIIKGSDNINGLFSQLSKEEKNPGIYKWVKIKRGRCHQVWISSDPEIRVSKIYSKSSLETASRFFIEMKGKPSYFGDPCQEKHIFRTTGENYSKILDVVCGSPFTKTFNRSIIVPITFFTITYKENGKLVTYEVKDADDGNRVWVDVIFSSKEEARNFNMREEYLSFLGEEITGNPGKSMKRYWYDTRVCTYQMS